MIRFRKKDHRYLLDGVPVPSVTQVIQHSNKFKLSGAVVDAAAAKGQLIHQLIKQCLDDPAAPTPIEYAPWIEQFRLWSLAVKFEPMATEKIVYSEDFGYAGRLDFGGWVNGRLAVVDCKTGVVPKGVGMQLAAYRHAWVEMDCSLHGQQTIWPTRFGYSLRLRPDSYQFRKHTGPEDHFFDFIQLLKIYKESDEWRQILKSERKA